jgi:uncharacterized protein (DUF433 family)
MVDVIDRVRIVVDGEVMGGEPCVEGTRIPVETIIVNLRAGHSLSRIYGTYPTLPRGSIEAAIDWAEGHGMDWRK